MKIADFLPDEALPAGAPGAKRLSEVLAEAANVPEDRISIGDLTDRLAAFGLAPVVLLMGLINLVTFIPGSSTVLGLPLVFLGLALIFGSQRLWLPARLRARTLDRRALQRGVARAQPWLQRIERWAQPRFWPGGDALLDRAYGTFVLFFALMIALPVPFGNTMPAFAVILISMGFTMRDGLWVLAGLVAGTLAIGVVIGVAGAIGLAGASLLNLF